MIKELKVGLGLDASGFKRGTNEAVSSAKKMEGSFLDVQSAMKGMLAMASFGAVVAGVKKAMEAQAAQEKAVNSLNIALANQGRYSDALSKSLQGYASSLQDVSRFGDEATMESMAMLASFGQNEEQLKRTTTAAANFASATGGDLRSAADLLGKAFAGNTGMLSRYGIIVDESLPKTEKFEAALSQLEKRFGGMAEAETKTFTGGLQQLNNAIGDVWETLGKFIGFATSSGDKPFAGLISGAKALQTLFGVTLPLAFSELKALIAEAMAWIASKAGAVFDVLGKLPGMGKYKVMGDEMALFADGLTKQAASYREAGNAAATSAGNFVKVTNTVVTSTTALTEAQKALASQMEELSGAAAQKEMTALAAAVQGVRASGKQIADMDALVGQIEKLAKAGAVIPEDLIPAVAQARAKKITQELIAIAREQEKINAATTGDILAKWAEEADDGLRRTLSALEALGPGVQEVTKDFKGLMAAVNMKGGVSKLNNAELRAAIDAYVKLAETEKLADDQIIAGNELIREGIDRNIDGVNTVVESSRDWGAALQGVAMLAGLVGGEFGEMLQIVQNIGQSVKDVDWGARNSEGGWMTGDKFNAIAGAAGQIGGMIGGNAGATIQGAAGGAMTGFAIGGPIGAGVGAVAGGIMGLLGNKKKKREEERAKKEAEKKAYEDLTKSIEKQFGSITKARLEARKYGIDLKAAMDTKDAKALEAAMADLEKRTKGMQTAMEGAAGLANYKAGSESAAAAQGALFGTVFWAAVKTQGYTAAVAALGEPFDTMWANAGEKMQAVLAPIRTQIDLARNESFAAAAEGASALAQLLSGIADAGIVSIGDLTNASILASDQYAQALAAAQEQGLQGAAAEEAAIRAVGPAVAELIAQYEALGIPLDENLKKLKETAENNGLAFKQEPIERAAAAMERVAAALERAYGGAKGLATEIERGAGASRNYRTPDYSSGVPTTGGDPADYTSAGGLGPVTLRRNTRINAHAGEKVVIVPKNKASKGNWNFVSAARGLYEIDDAEARTVSRDYEPPPATVAPEQLETTVETAVATAVASAMGSVAQQIASVVAAAVSGQPAAVPVTVTNAPVIQITNQSAVQTAEGQQAFGKYVVGEVEKALDQNTRGLGTRFEQIAERVARRVQG